ncbi:MAG: dihydroorotate dehydrogenase [Candidatus Saccharibacteria bacterium]|nr:dihydroorotate dehydrogenase [Candidatus Saccharibacteria bacterium]
MADLQARYEIMAGEGLKSAAERSLEIAGSSAVGRYLMELYASNGMGRTTDPSLHTEVSGVPLENPVIVGAGWDKKGRAIHGLYALGFAAAEIGTVLPFGQYGNEKPRLWTINQDHSVGLNRLGFNSPGDAVVDTYLQAAQPLPCPIGLNVGRNKTMPNETAAWAHERVIRRLGHYASYIVLGISSPNTVGLRGLQDKGPLRELIQSALAAMTEAKPLFIKIDSERSKHELNDMIEVGLEEGLSGFVATNTYMGSDLKAKYGIRWAREAGGLSGADPEYRKRATATVRHIHEEAGDKLTIIGVGGVDSAETALEKIKAGASAVQVVTAIRSTKGRVAEQINRELVKQIDADGMRSIRDYIGLDTKRGVKAA